MRVDAFDFVLDPESIALAPASPRDSARMLVVGPHGDLTDAHVRLALHRDAVAKPRPRGTNRGVIPLFPQFHPGCDLIARTLFAPVELPVGIVTAIIGGPFFLWLLVRRRS